MIFFTTMQVVLAQDPVFSQFFSSPLNVNPSLTANIHADWRAIANFRNQWIGASNPYVTGTISYDRKILQNKIPNVTEENNRFGIGGMMLFDYAMGSIVKSNYASLNFSYNIKLSEGMVAQHRLGAGFGTIYGNRRVDFSRLDFEEQFTGFGFNTNLPTGETALSNMKPYFSLSAGLVYSITTEKINMDLGLASFHINNPKQTYLQDPNQTLGSRKVVHGNFETFIGNDFVLNANAIYQFQRLATNYSIGAALGYYLPSENDLLLTGGIWYARHAIVPYLGIGYKDLQIGMSYDAPISKIKETSRTLSTFELSIILRGKGKPGKIIPCPWK